MAGEISDFFYKVAKERSDAAAKRREQAWKQIDNEPDVKKKIDLLSTHPDLKTTPIPTGGFVILTNNGRTEIAHVLTNHGVSEFGLERRGFTFIVASNGRCRYTERSLKPPPPPLISTEPRTKSGFVSMVEFHRIAQFMVEINYWDMDESYDAAAHDYPTVFSTGVRNGTRKSIRNFADAGPSRLWGLKQLIDSMRAHVKWDADK